jgi:hypothetical protein
MITHLAIASNGTSKDADIQGWDGTHTFLCVVHPWSPELSLGGPFFLLSCGQMRKTREESGIIQLPGHRHELCGKLIAHRGKEIAIGEFTFELDLPPPGDSAADENIKLICKRISA